MVIVTNKISAEDITMMLVVYMTHDVEAKISESTYRSTTRTGVSAKRFNFTSLTCNKSLLALKIGFQSEA